MVYFLCQCSVLEGSLTKIIFDRYISSFSFCHSQMDFRYHQLLQYVPSNSLFDLSTNSDGTKTTVDSFNHFDLLSLKVSISSRGALALYMANLVRSLIHIDY